MSRVVNWPNVLTFIRISFVPLMVAVFYIPHWGHILAAVFFAIACLTDWLDGYLARYLQQATKLGAFLDPVADKLIVCIALVLLAGEPQFQYLSVDANARNIPTFFLTIPAAIIVSREIFVSALREWMAELGKRAKVSVSYLGKIKTAVQMCALTVLLYCDNNTNGFVILVGYILLYLAAVLTIWSMLLYLKLVRAEFE